VTLSAPDDGVPPQGWFIEIDIERPDQTGTETVRPAVEGEPEWSPTVNEKPTVDIPVRPKDYLLSRRADAAPLRVWRDGQRLPIEEVASVERQEGDGKDTLTITGVGGVELDARVQRVYQNRPAHNAVRDLINAETGLKTNVDDPLGSSGTATRELLSVTTSAEFENNLKPVAASGFGGSVPLELDSANDLIKRQQTSWLWTAADTRDADQILGDVSGSRLVSDPDAAAGTALEIDAFGDKIASQSPTVAGYNIPAENVGVAIRLRVTSAVTNESSLEVGANFGGDAGGVGFVDLQNIGTDYEWVQLSNFTGINPNESINVSAEFNFSPTRGGIPRIDAIAVYDTRLRHEFDDNPDPHLDAPSPYDSLDGTAGELAGVETGEQLSTLTLEGARLTVGLSTPPSETNLRLSAETAGGINFAVDSANVTVEPGGLDDRASGTVSLAGGGTQNASPATGINPHELDTLTLTGLATEERRLIGRSFDGDLVSVLQTIADDVGAVWEVAVDGDQLSLEWSRPGLRDQDRELTASGVNLKRETQVVRAATVIGGRVQRQQEITAPSPGDGTVSLNNDRLVSSTERVVDSSGTSTYKAVQDYEIDYIDGEFRVPSGSNISAGDSLTIEYQFRPTGRFEADGFDGDPRVDRAVDIPTVSTSGAANQAARRLVRETADARTEATVDLSDIDPGTSVVSALGVDRLADISESWRVAEFADRPTSPQVRLSTSRPVAAVVSQLERELGDIRGRI
jgi:hypothetical protein